MFDLLTYPKEHPQKHVSLQSYQGILLIAMELGPQWPYFLILMPFQRAGLT